jgi:hypothetical protein
MIGALCHTPPECWSYLNIASVASNVELTLRKGSTMVRLRSRGGAAQHSAKGSPPGEAVLVGGGGHG